MLDRQPPCSHPLALIRSLISCLPLIDYPFTASNQSIISSPSDRMLLCLMKLLLCNTRYNQRMVVSVYCFCRSFLKASKQQEKIYMQSLYDENVSRSIHNQMHMHAYTCSIVYMQVVRSQQTNTHIHTNLEEVFCGFLVQCCWRRSRPGGAQGVMDEKPSWFHSNK